MVAEAVDSDGRVGQRNGATYVWIVVIGVINECLMKEGGKGGVRIGEDKRRGGNGVGNFVQVDKVGRHGMAFDPSRTVEKFFGSTLVAFEDRCGAWGCSREILKMICGKMRCRGKPFALL